MENDGVINNRAEARAERGIYIHVPFCRSKCIYCDFYSIGYKRELAENYYNAVCREWKLRGESFFGISAATLYIGGGTPSLLSPRMIMGFRSMIDIPVSEFTIEINPDDVSHENVSAWKEAGVNRISMGIQSLNDDELKAIGRRHTAEGALNAYEMIRKEFDNISVDIMFGLPGQNMKKLDNTLAGILALDAQHISAYSLMYEERTALTRMRDIGKVKEVEEEDSVRMFDRINQLAAQAGYERYEISNYSKPGFRSLHNSNYWKGLPYIGLGPGAHSYDGQRTRSWNLPDLKRYLACYSSEGAARSSSVIRECEVLSDDELAEELIMTRLRTMEGIDLKEFESRFGIQKKNRLLHLASVYLQTGELLDDSSGHLRLSDSGIMISDEIISSLF